MRRCEITIDLGALRRNARRLRAAAAPAELWAVVKADGYGHGALDCGRAVLEEGASALCVATVDEGRELRNAFPAARIVVLGPFAEDDAGAAREAGLEVTISTSTVPAGLRVHAKVDTGMGRWGMRPEELERLTGDVAGVMTHLATADEPDDAFALLQLERFGAIADRLPGVPRHAANSAATLRFPQARYDAVRCGIALYGLSPFGDDPAAHGLEPVLSWRSYVAHVRALAPGEGTGYGRRFVAARPTRVGIVPVGYADGVRRDMAGATVLVAGERRRVVGAVSMDACAVELDGEEAGAPVTIVGDGLLLEEHARHLGTITYELACAARPRPARAHRLVVDA